MSLSPAKYSISPAIIAIRPMTISVLPSWGITEMLTCKVKNFHLYVNRLGLFKNLHRGTEIHRTQKKLLQKELYPPAQVICIDLVFRIFYNLIPVFIEQDKKRKPGNIVIVPDKQR